jgi:hypothetical protein
MSCLLASFGVLISLFLQTLQNIGLNSLERRVTEGSRVLALFILAVLYPKYSAWVYVPSILCLFKATMPDG